MTPEELLSRLIYRDAMMLVLDKPAGIPVHKGTGGGENLEQYFDSLRFGLPRTPALAHRLDRDTSGCLVLGRHRQALHRLGKLFEGNRIRKIYWAMVEGTPEQAEGTIDLPLVKQSESRNHWRMKVAENKEDEGVVSAVTDYRVLGTAQGMSWLELRPQTGRTHQLRVHSAAMGWPIIGDKIYGSGQGLMQLHARSIEIPLYPSKEPILVTAPPPAHMDKLIKIIGNQIDNRC